MFFSKIGINQKDFTELGVKVCLPYKFDVDLTHVKDDGGGTQYTFYEAANARSVPILWKGWFDVPEEWHVIKDGVNAVTVSSAEELGAVIESDKRYPDIIDANWQFIDQFDAKTQAQKFYETTKAIWNETL
jgi:hypothetical protein